MKDREAIIRALMLKHVYNLPTTKVLIETLKNTLSLCRLCGWDSTRQVPSEATFSRTFKVLTETRLIPAMHEAVVRENYADKLVGHASTDSTEIVGREKACRIVEKKPEIKMTSQRVRYFYDLMDAAYDAGKIKDASKQMGHIPIIDPNPRRGEVVPLEPAKERRYDERTSVERVNSNLKDNYGGRNVRVKGHWKVLCHLMFGILAITVKQLFNMLV